MTYDHQAWLKERENRVHEKGSADNNIANQTLIALIERRQKLVERTYQLFTEQNHDALEAALSCIRSLDHAVVDAAIKLADVYRPSVSVEWRMAAEPEEMTDEEADVYAADEAENPDDYQAPEEKDV